MQSLLYLKNLLIVVLLCSFGFAGNVLAQEKVSQQVQKASKKIQKGFDKNNADTLAQGYFDLAESLYQKGDLEKSEINYQKSKSLYEKMNDADGIAKSSRALAKVQEELHKNKQAISNYTAANNSNLKLGDTTTSALNGNDIRRLLKPNSPIIQQQFLEDNLKRGLLKKDSNEIVTNYSRIGELNLQQRSNTSAAWAYNNAYQFSKNKPEQALRYNQLTTDVYLQEKNFAKAIETKQQVLKEPFVQNSTQIQASQITSLADIYIAKKEDATAIILLNESYALSVRNGHTLEAKKNIEKLDSIFQSMGKKDKSLQLYKDFLLQLPGIIEKDSSLTDNKIAAETEVKIKQLETDKALKDELITKKNIFNYWLIGFSALLILLLGIILFILKKIKTKNKKIALQSLRREMNPHFIFNSLNSINQFISNNNELEANQYLTKFSLLMRRVMENSKEDFVLLTNETELLHNYLELERSRFPDKFDFNIQIDDAIYAEEQLYIPCMLIQPHLENAIWHGLRYIEDKGFLQLSFTKMNNNICITIEDNGIGITESKKGKTSNQKKHTGRGITNTLERIKILNELYHQNITATVEDKASPKRGVIVKLTVPLIKKL